MKRILASVLFASVCLIAQAQNAAVQAVQDTFARLRSNNSVWLKMDARTEIGSQTYLYTIQTYWHLGLTAKSEPLYKLESTAYDKSGPIRRLIGDGQTFWAYEVGPNTFSSEAYWPEGAAQPATYQARLIQAFSRATKGSESFIARLIQEVYGGSQATYRQWVVAEAVNSKLIAQDTSAPDPMNPSDEKADFYAEVGEEIALFWAGSPSQPARRCVAFFFSVDDKGNRDLTAIEYRDRQGASRFDSFRMEIHPGVIPAVTNFMFVPPTNARPTVTTRPGIG